MPNDLDAEAGTMDSTSMRWRLRLGMPHLLTSGLAQGRFLEDCGSRHWHLLERVAGSPAREWRDGEGRRTYASFVGWEIQVGTLPSVAEGTTVQGMSQLKNIGATRWESTHVMRGNDAVIMRLALLSSFVTHLRLGDNETLTRVSAPPWPLRSQRSELSSALVDELRQRRQAQLSGDVIWSGPIPWSPAEDFNALGFLYFARFSRLLSIARWHAGVRSCERPPQPRRQVVSLQGNVNETDAIEGEVVHASPAAGRTIVLRRRTNNAVIATAWEE